MMKKLLFLMSFALMSLLAHSVSSSDWLSSKDWSRTSKVSFRGATIMDESFYDSIPLPYIVTNAVFDTLSNAKVIRIPITGMDYPAVGYKFTLTEKLPVSMLFSSDSIYMFAFVISDTVDLSNTLYNNIANGSTDSLDAGVYYMALFTNYQMGSYSLSITADTLKPVVPTFEEVRFPLDSVNINFSFQNTDTIDISGFGNYPATGMKFTVTTDTLFSIFLESDSIYEYTYALSDVEPTGYRYSDFFITPPDTLKAGTYYLTLITNNQYGDYNLYIHKGRFDSLQFQPITLPYGVNNAACESVSDIVIFDGDPIRAKGYEFSIAQDTVVIFSDTIYGISDYYFELYDSSLSSLKTINENDTVSLVAGTYYLVLSTYNGPFTYDFSVKQKGETVITAIKDVATTIFSAYTQNESIIISGLELNSAVIVFSLDGNIVSRFTADSDVESVSVPNSGVYIVNVNGVSKKLIVK